MQDGEDSGVGIMGDCEPDDEEQDEEEDCEKDESCSDESFTV